MIGELGRKVLDIASAASAEILEVYQRETIESQLKQDESPLTEADLRSNRLITQKLREISEWPVVSEEEHGDHGIRTASERIWLVDPLDGTKNFLARDGEFTINIALVEDGTARLGVVLLPAKGVAYVGELGQGAYRVEGGEFVKISNNREGTDLIAAGSRFHGSEETLRFCERAGVKEFRKFGSALKLCKLAEGEIDIYPRFSGSWEWDTAAGHCIAREANCELLDFGTRAEMVYGKPDLLNSFFVAYRSNLRSLIHGCLGN